MKRRHFMTRAAAVAGVVITLPLLERCRRTHAAAMKRAQAGARNQAKQGEPFRLNYGIHDGLFRSAGSDFSDQIRYAHDLGFRGIEDNGMMGRPTEKQEELGKLLHTLGMSMGVFAHAFNKWPVAGDPASGSKEMKEHFIRVTHEAVDTARRCGGRLVTVVPGNSIRGMAEEMQQAGVIEILRPAAEICANAGITMVLEPLSDNPDLFLRFSSQAYAICKAVNSPGCKILFDIYHMQRNEGDLIAGIDRVYDEIGYFQIGDNPGRNEPGTGEINYRNIFRHLSEKRYKGVLGMEHGVAGDGEEGEYALVQAYREADNF